MAPIPIYTQSPVNAEKADGATPKTAGSPESRSTPRRVPTTAAAPPPTSTSPYPAPQPGARPGAPTQGPAPTVTATHVRTVSSKYAPAAATADTTTPGSGSPPPPQPGAVPTPPGRTSLPPPPKAGESMASKYGSETAANAYPSPTTMPPQMGIPPPAAAYPSGGTSTNAIPPGPRPTSLFEGGAGPGPGNNPQGYQQEGHRPPGFAPAGYSGYPQPSGAHGQGGVLGSGEDDEGAWAAAKKWAQSAGTSIAAAEDEVWRRINKS